MNSFLALLSAGTIAAVLMFGLTWVLSYRIDNYSFVDVTWSYSIGLLAVLYWFLTPDHGLAASVGCVMALVWSLRLGTNLLLRVSKHHPHEDVRYQELRKKWAGRIGSAFFWFFMAQAVIALLLSLPFLVAARDTSADLSAFQYIGIGVFLIGFIGEALADEQLRRFKADPASKGKVCTVGLWHYSRHPNYFFESVIWFGVWLFACGSPWGWATVFAPLMILYFLLRVTGIPLTEKCAVASKGDAYRDYQRTTSAFVPWFRKTTHL